jgi:hypothetical protein
MFVIETENMGLSAFGAVEGIELPGQAVLDVRKLDFWPGLNPEAERPKNRRFQNALEKLLVTGAREARLLDRFSHTQIEQDGAGKRSRNFFPAPLQSAPAKMTR